MIFWAISGLSLDTPVSPFGMNECGAPVLQERGTSDPWFSRDKFLHFCGSAALSGLGYHVYATRLHGDTEQGGVFSVSLTGLIAFSKELYDQNRGGTFSWKDLIWDGFGIAVGYFVFVR
jgi:uncharacterized protein YfiM (DUF2279 family)